MAAIDIFNGDADGICALVQLRNAHPMQSTLVTGVKRDISLVQRAHANAGDRLTVLDVSFDKNRDGVVEALERGAHVFYVDHHFAGEVPEDARLTAIIDTSSNVCTSSLVNDHLQGAFAGWAITGAFGDNLKTTARNMATELELSDQDVALLDTLGTCINYNGYGASLSDLNFPPAELFERLRHYATPFAFIEEDRDTFERLESGYRDDMALAADVSPARETPTAAVFVLPDAPWARRVSGSYGNDLANASPGRAHAVLTERPDGTYLVSVRAPLENRRGADTLCRRFPTGGGRAAAAGINALPTDRLDAFIDAFEESYR